MPVVDHEEILTVSSAKPSDVDSRRSIVQAASVEICGLPAPPPDTIAGGDGEPERTILWAVRLPVFGHVDCVELGAEKEGLTLRPIFAMRAPKSPVVVALAEENNPIIQ